MQFSHVIGQRRLIRTIIELVNNNHFPHALLLNGKDGYGNMAFAFAIAQYISCENRQKEDADSLTDSCGDCPSCRKYDKLIHPDLHFIFPNTTTSKVEKDNESKLFASEFRDFILKTKGYGSLQDWYDFVGSGNKQGVINVKDADNIVSSLTMKTFESTYKIMIIWNADKMNQDCSNKILKIIEEPYANTVFILTTEHVEKILPTIISRVQQIKVPPIDNDSMRQIIKKEFGDNLTDEKINQYIDYASGDIIKLRSYSHEKDLYKMELFVKINRIAMMYRKSAAEISTFADDFSHLTREELKTYMDYFLKMVEQFYLYSIGVKKYIHPLENFDAKFQNNYPKFITANNLPLIYKVFQDAQSNIQHNANAKINIFDMIIKLGKALEKR